MDDLIYRKDAIKAVGYYHCNSGDKLLFADNALKELPSAQKWIPPRRCIDCENFSKTQLLVPQTEQQQWIPCSERLPDQNGKYLVVGRQKAINILKFDGGRWYGKWGVVAWMPLPKPCEGENNGHD